MLALDVDIVTYVVPVEDFRLSLDTSNSLIGSNTVPVANEFAADWGSIALLISLVRLGKMSSTENQDFALKRIIYQS